MDIEWKYKMEAANISKKAVSRVSPAFYTGIIRKFIDSGLKCAIVRVEGKTYDRVYSALTMNIRRKFKDAGIRVIAQDKEVYLWRDK